MTTQFTKLTRIMTILLTALALAANGAIIHGRPVMASTTTSYLPQENGEMDAAPSDFNGDGWADLAIGAPHEDVNGQSDAGAINVIYGTPYGLGKKCPRNIVKKKPKKSAPVQPECVINLPDNQYIDQETPGILEGSQVGDHFGSVLSFGDYNGDGYSDLAVGIPDEDYNIDTGVGGDGLFHANIGSVVVIYGSPVGLCPSGTDTTPESELWSLNEWDFSAQNTKYEVRGNERFGAALASGDFDADGKDDLAIGAPGMNTMRWPLYLENARQGMIFLIWGTAGGLTTNRYDEWSHLAIPSHIRSDRVENQANAGYGSSLAAGDFNGDAVCDLAVGAPLYDIGFAANAGALIVYPGTSGGPFGRTGTDYGDTTEDDVEVWLQSDLGWYAPKAGNQFAYSLAVGDFNGDRKDDLAIGMPFHDPARSNGDTDGRVTDAGMVFVMPGGSDHMDSLSTIPLERGEGSVIHFASFMEQFGKVLAAGDLNGDGFDDLAVGVQCDDSGGTDAGSVHIFYGYEGGVDDPNASTSQNQIINQQSPGIGETKEAFDLFGASLVILNFGKGAQADLAIGVPGEDRHNKQNIGMVHVLYGSQGHISGHGSQMLDQETFTSADTAEVGDFFGVAVN